MHLFRACFSCPILLFPATQFHQIFRGILFKMGRRKCLQYQRLFLAWFFFWYHCTVLHAQNHSTPTILKIGALICLNSRTGKAIKMALELALEKVNEDPNILYGTKLELLVPGSNCSVLQSAASAMQLMDDGVIAILGPQISDDSYFMSAMAEENHIPLVSFTATDPALSQLQYPYFIRVVPSDAMQMAAIASIIDYYEWKEVVALFTDDDFGRNAIYALRNSLEKIGSRISYKIALDPNIQKVGIQKVLLDLHKIKPRVILVHMQPDLGQTLLSVAIHLKMFNSSYVWIVTDGIASILDTLPFGVASLTALEGIICTQVYIPPSLKFKYLYYELRKRLGSSCCQDQNLRAVAFYAYDALWVIAKAVHSLLNQKKYDLSGGPDTPSGTFNPANGRESTDVSPLLHQIQKTSFLGTTGLIGFDAKGDRLHSVFQIINNLKTGHKAVGYWTSSVGYLTIQPPITIAESTFNATKRIKEPSLVTWPRGSSKVSRGQMPSMLERSLRIIVPNKAGFKKFVGVHVGRHNETIASGFCIEVFTTALAYLNYSGSYTFTAFGTGRTTPIYDDLIQKVADKEFDAAVGDITITRQRSNIVQFTQPFLESSLTVVVPKLLKKSSRTWQFFQPFSISMWCTMGACFIITGVVIWVLERRKNVDFRGRPKKTISTIIWFILSTLFFTQREKVKSVLGRMVLIVWFFVVLIITSSYTANLTSILTIEQLRPTVNGIGGLITSDDPIGYQSGSFVRDYLLELNVAKERLVPLNTLQNYRNALLSGPQRGGVAAIVEEKPYADLFISQRCEFKTSGEEFSKGDWGFAFQKGSQLAIDISTAILKLNEDGTLQRIREKYLGNSTCESSDEISSHLGTSAFLGLFLITGLVSILALISHCVKLARLFCVARSIKEEDSTNNEEDSTKKEEDSTNKEVYREGSSKCASIMHSVKSFLEFTTKEEIPRKERKEMRRKYREQKREKQESARGRSSGRRVKDKSDDEDQSVNPSLHGTESSEIEGFGSEGKLTVRKCG